MNLLNQIKSRVNLEEDTGLLENILCDIYFHSISSSKILARRTLLPVPVVSAIKKEFVKAGIITSANPAKVTATGEDFLNNQIGYAGMDKDLFTRLVSGGYNIQEDFKEEYEELQEVMANRPQVDVTLDQSKGTVETALHRAVLGIRNNCLVGKQILCLGDDDLVSIGIGFLFKRLFKNKNYRTKITVIDIDKRFLDFINAQASEYGFPVSTVLHDLRNPLPGCVKNKFTGVYTDPPYTLPGLSLFLSRAVDCLDKNHECSLFLSYPHKPAAVMSGVFELFNNMKLVPMQIMPRFNTYDGAGIIGNISQLIHLKTTKKTIPQINDDFKEPIYTGELRLTKRLYKCKNCKAVITVGKNQEFETIEDLKNKNCQSCGASTFDLMEKILL